MAQATSSVIFISSRMVTTLVNVFQFTLGTKDIQYLSATSEIPDTPLISDGFSNTITLGTSVYSVTSLIKIDKYKILFNGSFDDINIYAHYGLTRVGGVILNISQCSSVSPHFAYEAIIEVIDCSALTIAHPQIKDYIDTAMLQFDLGLYLNGARQKTIVTSISGQYPALSLSSSVFKRALTVTCGTNGGTDGLSYIASQLGVSDLNIRAECECQMYGYDINGQLVQTYQTVLTGTATQFQTYLPDIIKEVVSLNIAIRYQFNIETIGVTLPFYDDVVIVDQELANLRLLTIEDLIRGNDVSVIVLGLNSMPISGALVAIGPETQTTDVNGVATFLGLSTGIYPLAVTATNYDDFDDDLIVSDTNKHKIVKMHGINATADFDVKDYYGQPQVVNVKYVDGDGVIQILGPASSFTITGEYGLYQLELYSTNIVTTFVNFNVPLDNTSTLYVDLISVPIEIITQIDTVGPKGEFVVKFEHPVTGNMISMQQIGLGIHRAYIPQGTINFVIKHTNSNVVISAFTGPIASADTLNNSVIFGLPISVPQQYLIDMPVTAFGIIRDYNLLTPQQVEPVGSVLAYSLIGIDNYIAGTQNNILVAYFQPDISISSTTYEPITVDLLSSGQTFYLIPGLSVLTVVVNNPNDLTLKTVTIINAYTGALYTVTQSDNVFQFNVGNANYNVTVTAPGYAVNSQSFTISGNLTVDMSLSITDRPLDIFVTDELGTGLPLAHIDIDGQLYQTDESGHLYVSKTAGFYAMTISFRGKANMTGILTVTGDGTDGIEASTHILLTKVHRMVIQILDAAWSPVSGHSVDIDGNTYYTDIDGQVVYWNVQGPYAYSFTYGSNTITNTGDVPGFYRYVFTSAFDYLLDTVLASDSTENTNYPTAPGVNRVTLQIAFDQGDDTVDFVADVISTAVFNAKQEQNIGTLTYSIDNGITWLPVTVPFTINPGDVMKFKRTVISLPGVLTLRHTSLTHEFDSVAIRVNTSFMALRKAPDIYEIEVKDTSGNTVPITLDVTNKTIVTPPVTNGVRYNRQFPIRSFADVMYSYDYSWHLIDGTYTYTTAYNAITVQLSDRYHLHPDTPNAFGTFLRFTNSLGNQVLDGSDGSLPLYVIDHFTGYGWYVSAYIDTLDNALTFAAGSTQHGFTDWRIPSPEEGLTIANVQDTNNTFDHISADPDGLFNLGFNLFTNMPALNGSSSWFIANSSVSVDSLQLIGSIGSAIVAPYFMIRNHY